MSVKEVAAACGFASQNHLARLFVETFGKTPTAYRGRSCCRHPGTAALASKSPKALTDNPPAAEPAGGPTAGGR